MIEGLDEWHRNFGSDVAMVGGEDLWSTSSGNDYEETVWLDA